MLIISKNALENSDRKQQELTRDNWDARYIRDPYIPSASEWSLWIVPQAHNIYLSNPTINYGITYETLLILWCDKKYSQDGCIQPQKRNKRLVKWLQLSGCESNLGRKDILVVRKFIKNSLNNSNVNTLYNTKHGLRTPRESFFFQKSRTFGLGQTFWAEIFWGIWGIFGQTIKTILALWVPCSWENVLGCFSYKKTLVLRPKTYYSKITPKYDKGRKEFRK